MQTIDRQTLLEQLQAGNVALVEALPLRYYASGHLPGALHLPHDEVELRAPTLLPDRRQPVVVYCANVQCQNSHQAAHRLRALGYTDVRVYAGGKQDWTDAGLLLQSEETAGVA